MKNQIEDPEIVVTGEGKTYHLGISPSDNLPKNIFLVGDPHRAFLVAKYFDNENFSIIQNREFVTLIGNCQNLPIAVIGTGIGPDHIEIVANELHILNEYDSNQKIWKEGAQPLNIIRLGTSGSFHQNIRAGSLAISVFAIGLDNLGQYYPFQSDDHYIEIIKWQLKKTPLSVINPYVNRATPQIVSALIQGCRNIGLKENYPNGFSLGITASAPGFYAPQGRKIGRLESIAFPKIQHILNHISTHGMEVINMEMESSIMFRIFGELLHYQVGTICAVLANRKTGEIVTPQEYHESIDRCIRAGLNAMKILNEK